MHLQLALVVVILLPTDCFSKTILLSLDGFRWDYLDTYSEVLPTFKKFANDGVQVTGGVLNAFITKTFPNHRSMATGLWEESHGIIANNFWAPDVNATFTLSSEDLAFWKEAEPMWVTAEHSNVTTVCIQFPGCSVLEQRPSYTLGLGYSSDYGFTSLVDNLTLYLNKEDNPAELGLLYYFEPDHTGHLFGPNSEEMRDKLAELDGYFHYFLSKLSDTDNILVTADHGMGQIPVSQVISIEGYLNDSYIEHIFYTTYTELLIYCKEQYHDALMEQLDVFVKDHPHFTVYAKKDIPTIWHYKNNERSPDILMVAEFGWLVVQNQDSIDYLKNKTVIGQHGFNNRRSEMHPVFLARGPVFKQGYTLPKGKMRIVDVFPLVAHIAGFPAEGRNGTLDNVKPLLNYPSLENNTLKSHRDYQYHYYFILLGSSLLTLAVFSVVYCLYILITGRDCVLGYQQKDVSLKSRRLYKLQSDFEDDENLMIGTGCRDVNVTEPFLRAG